MLPRKPITFLRSGNVLSGNGCIGYSSEKQSGQRQIQGKNVAYVGGFGGIGFACCKELMGRGIQSLVILDKEDSPEKRRQLESLNPNAKSVSYIPLNLSEGKKAIATAMYKTIVLMDPIDILINGAGILMDRNPRQTIDVNLLGPIETTLAAIPLMRRDESSKKGNGLIVNVASVLGLVPGSFAAVYTASKHAIIGFTRACADEHYEKTTGISHMAICHGVTDTPLVNKCVGADTFDFSRPLSEEYGRVVRQTVEESAKIMVEAIQNGKNGSIVIVDLGHKVEVGIPTFWKPLQKKS